MTVQRTCAAVPETAWFKSSYSTGNGGECVEVASVDGSVHVRDSKNVPGPTLTVSPTAWTGLVSLAVDRTV
ncbi:DUF397 domain-containing protein [Streptomyces sp. NPDC059104]|uniref:DUF397 domain-containing protein n=1 Tax=Streptomyces sp. NPDC059104 TaxID=3346729 RepID=UPI003692E263